jgi:hypothetical protein
MEGAVAEDFAPDEVALQSVAHNQVRAQHDELRDAVRDAQPGDNRRHQRGFAPARHDVQQQPLLANRRFAQHLVAVDDAQERLHWWRHSVPARGDSSSCGSVRYSK